MHSSKEGFPRSGTPPEFSSRHPSWDFTVPSCNLKQTLCGINKKHLTLSKETLDLYKGKISYSQYIQKKSTEPANGSAFLALLFILPWSLGKVDSRPIKLAVLIGQVMEVLEQCPHLFLGGFSPSPEAAA